MLLIVGASIFLAFLIYYYVFKSVNYWEKRGIPYVKGLPIVGNMGKFVTKQVHLSTLYEDMYNSHPNDRYVGLHQFSNPSLLVRDVDLIKQMTIKDFDHFVDHKMFFTSKSDEYLNKMLFNLTGNEWREMRATLSPAFTSGKMRNMYLFISECAQNFAKFFTKQNKEIIEIEVRDLLSRFTTDVVASTSFGVKCNSLEEPKNEFISTARTLMQFGFIRNLKLMCIAILPSAITKMLKIKMFPMETTMFFNDIVHDTIAQREKHNILRLDLIHLLMEAKKGTLKHETITQDQDAGFATVEESDLGRKQDNRKKELTDLEITAQALLFFFGGVDTTTTTIGFLLYELALNPDVQRKLQREIDGVKKSSNGGTVAYDVLLKMKYLDQVVSESLRKWPPGFFLDRVCVKDYKIEPSTPEENSLILEKGVQLIIPVIGIHHNPEYYPEPQKFDPDRFSDENKHKLVSGSYIPFGTGPRNCIGSRFALLVVKAITVELLSEFDLVPVEKTPIPYKLNPMQFNMVPENIFLGLKPREASDKDEK